VKVVVGAATDIGQVREGNEDSYLLESPLFAVADGMGGHRGGEVASSLALETLQALFRQGAGDLDEQVQEANRAVFDRSMHDRSVAGMGTTLTAALTEGGRIRLAHVGDSRAYLLRNGELQLLTEDHTLVHRMVMEGEISEEEAEAHPHRSVLTRALGVDTWVDIDDLSVEVRGGDRLLLCTDGLTAMIADRRIRRMLAEQPDPQAAADALVAAANEAGGVDNITVVVLDFTQEDLEHGSAPAEASAPSDRAVDRVPAPEEPHPRSTLARSETRPPPGRRSATTPLAGRPPLRSVGAWAGVAIAIVLIGLVGLRFYVDRQWYVGVSGGHVAIYRGIPTKVAGFELHHVVVETTISADAAESLTLYSNLTEGITAADRHAADAIVEQIRRDVARLPDKTPSP
jgi:serine/threonine protein phosphatase PrpC